MTSKSHYEAHTAETYESAFFYEEGAYTKYLCDLVVQRLCLKDQQQHNSQGTLVDIGGGTGNFTRMLVKESPGLKAVVVDPFLPESSSSQQGEDLQFVKASAEDYTKENFPESDKTWREGYSQVLLKEVVHHFEPSNRQEIFRGLLKGSKPFPSSVKIPSLLIITRPQREIDYPLWKEAREIWAENQPHVDDLMKDLSAAGFATVDYTVEAYPCEISLERWQKMVKQRFWSTFANFTDAELEAACKTIAAAESHRTDSTGVLRFEDRLVFIQASIR